jgi:hypothetical protein
MPWLEISTYSGTTAGGPSRSYAGGTAANDSADGNSSTLAHRHTVANNLGGIRGTADSSGTITEAIEKVALGAETGQIAGVATKLAGLLFTKHVAHAGLLHCVN